MNLKQDTHISGRLQKLIRQAFELADYARSRFDIAPLALGYYPGHVADDRSFCQRKEQLKGEVKSLFEQTGDSLEYHRFIARLERHSPSIEQGSHPVRKRTARCRCWWDARDELLEIADYLEEFASRSQSPTPQVQEVELFVEDIDSFCEVRNIQPQEVRSMLPLNLPEDKIQTFFEEIIGENFHQEDWGGEQNDLVTSQVKVDGKRVRAAFLLKGRGTRGKLTIAKCGKNGDQIVRLVEAPVGLYVIQHVGEIDQRVVYDLKSKVQLKVSEGHRCQMCILDGTETARILRAYGRI